MCFMNPNSKLKVVWVLDDVLRLMELKLGLLKIRYFVSFVLHLLKAIGGTCVNVGCVPKKVMWYTANHADALHDLVEYGFNVPKGTFSWKTIKNSRDSYIQRLHGIYHSNLEKDSVQEIVTQLYLFSSSGWNCKV